MSENLKKFIEFVGNNPDLIEKAKQLKADDPEKATEIAIAFAKENGFELSEDDFEISEGKLSANELNAVAGGGTCACVIGGGGTEDDSYASGYDNKCCCIVGGFGYDIWGDQRCACALGGGGAHQGNTV